MKTKILLLSLLSTMLFSIPNSIEAKALKLIAYNVEFGRNTTPEAIAQLLKSEQADIICFNEVPVKAWTKKVGELLGLKHSYEGTIASANHEKDFKDQTGKYYGKYKSILSRYPLTNTHELELNGIGWSPATAVAAKVQLAKNKTVQVFSLHIPSGESKPTESMARSLSKILGSKYPSKQIILAGDFNDLVDSEPLKYLYKTGFKNSWKALNMDVSTKTTYPDDENMVIDHVIFKGLRIKGAGIIEEQGKTQSDHKPIWSKFEL